MKKWVILSVLLAALAVAMVIRSFAKDLMITDKIATEGGIISGEKHGVIRSFKGIPYAKAPVGELRWHPPQRVDPWLGILKATAYGPACLQPDQPGLVLKHEKRSEDCLYLNVWTGARSIVEKRPVMVWLHSGWHITGAGHLSTAAGEDGEALAKKGVVVISFNYRLGIFGYFAHPLLSRESSHNVSGNYGLLDQIAALKWVKKNIKAFGGDPGNVTIFGSSSGAFDVGYLMASPLAEGLFHRAISESGSVFYSAANRHLRDFWYGMEAMETQGKRISWELGCEQSEDPAAALRSMSAEDLLKGSRASLLPPGNQFSPVIDGWVLPDDVMTIFEKGKHTNVPLIAGVNADEGSVFVPWIPYNSPTAESYKKFIKENYGSMVDEISVKYPAYDILRSLRDLWADFIFIGPTRNLIKTISRNEGKVYLYYFTMATPGRMARYGAFHCSEVPFVFNDLDRVKKTSHIPFEAKHHLLAETMSGYWAQFAKTGNPNKKGLPEWPVYNTEKEQYIEFGEKITISHSLRKARLDLQERYNEEKRMAR